jgi:phosphoribosylamine---glycine ligase
MSGRRVLVIGKGGREHALAERLLVSESVGEVIVAPGNAGTNPGTGAGDALASALSRGKILRNGEGTPLELARAVAPDLVVIGPEAPLCDGLADELSAAGFVVYGPSRAAARLEGSKAFLKDFAVQHGINTARHVTVRSEAELGQALAQFREPPVVKADGLCAGKGVVVADTHEEAEHAAREMLSGRAFGAAGRTLVLEERLYGSEISAHAICDGTRGLLLPFVQDHKRLRDGDAGPNTGGMGTYGPVAMPDPRLTGYIQREIVDKVLAGMAQAGTPFRGTLFAGLMLCPGGDPALIEINVRFGDPETQVLTNILDGDFCELLLGAARGRLDPAAVSLAPNRSALCVILAAPGYPSEPRLGEPIRGLAEAGALPGVHIYHAGTSARGSQTLTAGGRVLAVTGVGDSLMSAHERAYAAAGHIDFDGKQQRADIAHQALGNAATIAPGAPGPRATM